MLQHRRITSLLPLARRARRLSASTTPGLSRLATKDFAYDLPAELIAQEAADPRDASRLLVCMPSTSSDDALRTTDLTFAQMPTLLGKSNAHLVLNESAVFEARMFARPEGEAALQQHGSDAVEVMFLAPEPPDLDATLALSRPAHGQRWRAMLRLPLESAGLSLVAERRAAAGGPAMRLHVERLFEGWEEPEEGRGVECEVRFELEAPAAESSADGTTDSAASEAAPVGAPQMRDVFAALGDVPLPPYIRGGRARAEDAERYQSVYANAAQRLGSVAAPTAGLHFTPALLGLLAEDGVRTSHVALHVGAGTFKPVTSEVVSEHTMHAERFGVSVDAIEDIAASAAAGRPIVPVGTTSARTLESLYWLGLRWLRASRSGGGAAGADCGAQVSAELGAELGAELAAGSGGAELAAAAAGQGDVSPWVGGAGGAEAFELGLGALEQWPGYLESAAGGEESAALPAAHAVLSSLASAARDRGLPAVGGVTSLCIAPGYRLRVCDALVTNFHMPDSSLMMLVAAMVGSAARIHGAYAHAVAQRYRFLSYGDACLLFNHQSGPATAALARHVAGRLATARLAAMPPPAAAAAAAVEETEPPSTWVVSRPVAEGQAAVAGPLGDTEEVRKVLLHSCCAPCSGAMVEAMVEAGHDVTVFFYNPNIHPRKEYELRKSENKRYAATLGIDFVDLDNGVEGGIDVDKWYKRAKGMEFCPERGTRCSMCFDMRLERTALFAYEHGFDSFTTTNATSRWKDEAQVNASGVKAAAAYPGVEYWLSDWQTEEMTQRKYRINAQEEFYKQEYCGCSYSLRDSNHWRSKQGQPPIEVGGGGIYSDPEVDEQEESVETVAQFFSDSTSFEQELKQTYAARRKGKKDERDNW